MGQCVGHLELLIRGGLGQSGAVVEQGSKGRMKEQRNSRNERNSRSRETATLRTASPSIFLEWGGGGGDRSDSASRSLRTADVSPRLSPLRTSLKGDEREKKRLPFAGYASRVRNKRSTGTGEH